MADSAVHPSPTRSELHAWRSFLTAHARVLRDLEAELLADQRLSLMSYDVLVQLAEAPARRLRMAELADRVLLSRSGVTRLVDRLERAGLVARHRVADDGRGVIAELTDAGLERLRIASRTHLAGVARHFVARFQPHELEALRELCDRLARTNGTSGDRDATQPHSTRQPDNRTASWNATTAVNSGEAE